MPLYKIDEDDQQKCINLIYNTGHKNPLFDFIEHFDKKAGIAVKKDVEEQKLPLDEKIKQRIIQGNKHGLEDLLKQALKEMKPLNIINNLLIPGMKVVGDLFGSGQMQLPFVLQSAEVMKFAVDKLKPFMEKTDTQSQTSIVLATVRGDVHDIGKNLVEIIMSNNGYKVYNLGIKCEIDTILQKALEVKADAIGMSGLLVKSTVVMQENLEEMSKRNIQLPVLLGGAALTQSFVQNICSPILEAPVVYCADAFAGLNAMAMIKDGTLADKIAEQQKERANRTKIKQTAKPKVVVEKINRDISIPNPPFWGTKIVSDINLDTVFSYLTESVLFRGRWGLSPWLFKPGTI